MKSTPRRKTVTSLRHTFQASPLSRTTSMYVASEMPSLRMISVIGVPASAWRSAAVICSSEYRDLRNGDPPIGRGSPPFSSYPWRNILGEEPRPIRSIAKEHPHAVCARAKRIASLSSSPFSSGSVSNIRCREFRYCLAVAGQRRISSDITAEIDMV